MFFLIDPHLLHCNLEPFAELVLRQIVEPAGAFLVRPREYLAHHLSVPVLVVAHIKSVVIAEVQNLDLARVVRHDVLERLLNAAQPLIQAANDLYAPAQRDLEMRRAFYGASLEDVVRSGANRMAYLNRGRENVRIIIDLS